MNNKKPTVIIHEVTYIFDRAEDETPEQLLPSHMDGKELRMQVALGTFQSTDDDSLGIVYGYCPICEGNKPLDVYSQNIPNEHSPCAYPCKWFTNKYRCLNCHYPFQKLVLKGFYTGAVFDPRKFL